MPRRALTLEEKEERRKKRNQEAKRKRDAAKASDPKAKLTSEEKRERRRTKKNEAQKRKREEEKASNPEAYTAKVMAQSAAQRQRQEDLRINDPEAYEARVQAKIAAQRQRREDLRINDPEAYEVRVQAESEKEERRKKRNQEAKRKRDAAKDSEPKAKLTSEEKRERRRTKKNEAQKRKREEEKASNPEAYTAKVMAQSAAQRQRQEDLRINDPEAYEARVQAKIAAQRQRREDLRINDPEAYEVRVQAESAAQRQRREDLRVDDPEAYKVRVQAGSAVQAQRREDVRTNQPELHEERLAQRRLNYRYQPLEEHESQLDARRLAYENMSAAQRQRQEDLRINDPEAYEARVQAKIAAQRQRREDLRINDPEAYEVRVQAESAAQRQRREDLRVDDPEAYKVRVQAGSAVQAQRREDVRTNQPELHEERLAQRRLNYRYQPLEEHESQLDARRLAYENMNAQERAELLQQRKRAYRDMSPTDRYIHLEAARRYQQERRNNYTSDQIQHEQEANAQRQREIRQRRSAAARAAAEQAMIPIGCRCNMDNHNLNTVRYFDVGNLEVECSFCQALGFKGENKGSLTAPHFGERCCRKGKIELERYPDLPPYLLRLFTADAPESRYFRDNIRYFNSGMALASCVVNDQTVKRYGPACFKVSGVMHRRMGPLLQQEGSTQPNCMQTYFHDPEFQARHRAMRGSPSSEDLELRTTIFRNLHRCLIDCENSYLRSFLSVNEYITQHNLDPQEFSIVMHSTENIPAGHHPGRYHLPTAPEVALLKDINPPDGAHRLVKVAVRGPPRPGGRDQLSYIPCYSQHYTPLQYVCFFPYGTKGSTLGMKSKNVKHKKQISMMEWFRYHSRKRPTHLNFLHLGRKLFQQFIVDEFERHQTWELWWFRNNQKTIRAELYDNLHANRAGGRTLESTGRVMILPATYTCSDRWYRCRYKNAMAVVRVKGPPSLFITVTMDVNCEEVRRLLEPGQTPYDRPDIICQVYEIKKKEILRLITKEHIFGQCDGHVAVIEFQKRGAPHCHMLIWLKDFEMTPQNIDNIISAELPPPDHPMHERVVKLMMHGPCGPGYNTKLGCCKDSKDGSCQRNFPKQFNSRTFLGDGSFTEYRRRSPAEGGHTAKKWVRPLNGYAEVDNRWVVPYNLYLLKKFDCHINVECCASITSVKYLFLYHFKGCDLITIEMQDLADEIGTFQARQYISACYAYWRMAKMDMHSISPSVHQLPLHLENKQTCTFELTEESINEVLKKQRYTMLTEYFTANTLYGDQACSLKYEDFPIRFVWKEDERMWTPRVRETSGPEAVGRMVSIHPTSGDIFYLRMLLKNRAGAISFEDLRTVDGVLSTTNKAACVALGLCDDDSEWIDCLTEAVQLAVPRHIRVLFCTILLQCNPTSPEVLYEKFKSDMSEDFLRKRKSALNLTGDMIEALRYNDLLHAINNYLGDHEKGNSSYNLPMPDTSLDDINIIDDSDEYDPNAEEYYNKYIGTLTDEQSEILHRVIDDVETEKGGLHRVDAPGGSGKTHLANLILASLRKLDKIALATALSGIAATILKLGKTFHRQFKVPVPCHADSSSGIRMGSHEAEVIRAAALIMIDEVSMMNWRLLNLLDRFLRILMNKDTFMGGKCVILMGDLRQCPPVVTGGSRPAIVEASVINAEAWCAFTKHQLTKNMRVERIIAREPHRQDSLRCHAKWLLDLGNGKLPTVLDDIIEIPTQMVCDSPEDLESRVYDDFETNMTNKEYLLQRSIMSSTNDTIHDRNYKFIDKLPGKMQISYSRDSCVEENDHTLYEVEFINRLNVSGLPPHRLPLKIGACIILIRNLDVTKGHCNGTRYIILELSKNLIKAQKLDGSSNDIILIPRIPMISKDSSFPVPFKRVQFPVLGAYYLTINRAQGQTLGRAGLYLPGSVFCHGHLYVGFGRCGDPKKFFVYADQSEFDNIRQHLDPTKAYTRNIIYPELLNN